MIPTENDRWLEMKQRLKSAPPFLEGYPGKILTVPEEQIKHHIVNWDRLSQTAGLAGRPDMHPLCHYGETGFPAGPQDDDLFVQDRPIASHSLEESSQFGVTLAHLTSIPREQSKMRPLR
jgi:hypothetical protein